MLGVISDLYSTLLPSPATFSSFERRGHQRGLQHQPLWPGPEDLYGVTHQVVARGVSPGLRVPGAFESAEVTPESHRGQGAYQLLRPGTTGAQHSGSTSDAPQPRHISENVPS